MDYGPGARLPIVIINGVREGPVVVVYAGIHGDEFEGISALWQLKSRIRPSRLAGTLVIVPVVHGAAYAEGTRASPVDGKNLARVFPGDRGGTFTERLAYLFLHEVVSKADYAIDLHSGGIVYRHHPVVLRYSGTGTNIDRQSSLLARSFAIRRLRFVWEIPSPPKNMTCTYAASTLGVTSIGAEMRGEGRCRQEDVRDYVASIVNAMKSLGMLEGRMEGPGLRRPLEVTGEWSKVNRSGYFSAEVVVGRTVSENQTLGKVKNEFGDVVEEIRAKKSGYVGALRTFPAVKEDDQTVLTWTPRESRRGRP